MKINNEKLEITATIQDVVKVKAFEAIMKAYKAKGSFSRKARAIFMILRAVDKILNDMEG